jgi:hypothetical protein
LLCLASGGIQYKNAVYIPNLSTTEKLWTNSYKEGEYDSKYKNDIERIGLLLNEIGTNDFRNKAPQLIRKLVLDKKTNGGKNFDFVYSKINGDWKCDASILMYGDDYQSSLFWQDFRNGGIGYQSVSNGLIYNYKYKLNLNDNKFSNSNGSNGEIKIENEMIRLFKNNIPHDGIPFAEYNLDIWNNKIDELVLNKTYNRMTSNGWEHHLKKVNCLRDR